ncbi:MAG: hypothetical protein KUG82_10460 [Pseudomonadales bacterium]|nr:hypothetical protein [Pseudomonadales bacterium]
MNAATVRNRTKSANANLGRVFQQMILSPTGVLASTLSVLGFGMIAIVILTETLLLPTLFGALMFAPVLSAIDHFVWHRKDNFSA